jgi:fatty acid-binding protein DegV
MEAGCFMNSVRVVADDGCDLSPALIAEYRVEIVPVFVRFGEEMLSSRELSLAEFWARTLHGTHNLTAGAKRLLGFWLGMRRS